MDRIKFPILLLFMAISFSGLDASDPDYCDSIFDEEFFIYQTIERDIRGQATEVRKCLPETLCVGIPADDFCNPELYIDQ